MKNENNRLFLILMSLILVVIPMIIFQVFSLKGLVGGSFIYVLFEFAFYGVVLFFFRRDTNLQALLVGAAICLFYRFAIGAFFGMILLAMFSFEKFYTPISWGMVGYLPAVLLHIVATPFVMRNIYLSLAERMSPEPARRARFDAEKTAPQKHFESKPVTPPPAAETPHNMPGEVVSRFSSRRQQRTEVTHEARNQIDNALSYIGEAVSVKMALLVDEEGLILGRFSRCEEDPELWAPLAVMLEGNNRGLLSRFHPISQLDKIDIGTMQLRIILRRIEHVTLMVLADRNIDETIHIRIAQASDMVRKYISERYSPTLFARVEERYVSNT